MASIKRAAIAHWSNKPNNLAAVCIAFVSRFIDFKNSSRQSQKSYYNQWQQPTTDGAGEASLNVFKLISLLECASGSRLRETAAYANIL